MQCFASLFSIWQFFDHSLANFVHFWANSYCFEWPKMGENSCHLVTLFSRNHYRIARQQKAGSFYLTNLKHFSKKKPSFWLRWKSD